MAIILTQKFTTYGSPISDEEFTRARIAFQSVVHGQNPLTPIFVGYCFIKDGVAEITKGRSEINKIYGITVVINNEKCKSSGAFYDMDEVNEFLNELV